MADKKEKTRYSPEELKEFEELILQKLRQAEAELEELKRSMMKLDDAGTSDTEGGNLNLLEDGADTLEKESINQLAARQQKFINQLRMALVRIKNGTYGICVDTGKLIPKERLRIVPHTQHSIEAKLNKD
ncbi:MAG: molecular chaperone DnaK [Thermonema sp.]|uniref:TraR/DksA family transcriptional regulator n=1 Tax=Thermonema TaxID=28194 RepID=UPI00056E06B1|nr:MULTISPECIES: TraR/DksA C4-type zinc finger protein [Thermonema]GIV38885.1 MAG: molecular chaperone DnaK [Thermonema sp.]